VLRQESDDPVDVKLVQRIVAHQQRVGALTQHGGEGVIEVGGAAHLDADVAARPGEARYQAGAHRIADANHHDQDGRGCCLGRLRRRGAEGRDQVDRTPIPCWTL